VEKIALGDGTQDGQVILDIGTDAAKEFLHFDMGQAADKTGSVISAVLLGAIAGSSCLPFSRSDFEESIRADGRSVDANLAGFAAGFEQIRSSGSAGELDGIPVDSAPSGEITDKAIAPEILELLGQIENKIPEPCRETVRLGLRRVLDYQDIEYGKLYLQRLCGFAGWDGYDGRLCKELARFLALRMTYEDTIRVAGLKIRSSRLERLGQEVGVLPDQAIHVTEFLRPRVEEICDTLPAWLGRWILGSKTLHAGVSVFCKRGRKITTTRLPGFLLLYTLASLKRWRRGSYRYAQENRQIESWLEFIRAKLPDNHELAIEITRCADLLKGYGDTHARGLANFTAIMEIVDEAAIRKDPEKLVRGLRDAALADEEGAALGKALSEFHDACLPGKSS
jgi:indolepyruvate ferredoxin oxidoreductase beta subunit